MGADHVALVRSHQVLIRVFVQIDVEVIEPEIRHRLLQLAFAVDRAEEFGLQQLTRDHRHRRAHGQKNFALVRSQIRQQTIALPALDVAHKQATLIRRKRQDRVIALLLRECQDFVGLLRDGVAVLLVDLRFCFRIRSLAFVRQLFLSLPFLQHRDLYFIDRAPLRIGRHGSLSILNRPDQVVRGKHLYQVARGHTQRSELVQLGVQDAVIDLIRMQLLFDPVVHLHGHHFL